MCPLGSYGRRNRQATADRETRITTRLHAVEHAYRTATERDMALQPSEPAGALHLSEPTSDKEIEYE